MGYEQEQLKSELDRQVKKIVSGYLTTEAFIIKKVADTPNDDYMVTPRGYVNANGSVAARPNSSVAVIGQKYFATDTKIPMVYDGTNWYNGVGSIVAVG